MACQITMTVPARKKPQICQSLYSNVTESLWNHIGRPTLDRKAFESYPVLVELLVEGLSLFPSFSLRVL